MLMRPIFLTLMMLCAAAFSRARSLSYALMSIETGLKAEPRPAEQLNFLQINRFTENEGRLINLPRCAGPKKLPPYDITRETGAYFFDTVYKLRMPATRRLHIGLNGGYTCYDRYLKGPGTGGGSLGLVGGVTLAVLRPGKAGAPTRKSLLRLNADLISYPYRHKAGATESYDLSRYTRDLSARVYFDARLTRQAFTTRCMAGVVASGTEQGASALPLFVGVAVCYRFP